MLLSCWFLDIFGGFMLLSWDLRDPLHPRPVLELREASLGGLPSRIARIAILQGLQHAEQQRQDLGLADNAQQMDDLRIQRIYRRYIGDI